MATQTRGQAADRPTRPGRPAKGRTGPVLFVRQVVAELHKVIWPTRHELTTYTTVALVFIWTGRPLVLGIDGKDTVLLTLTLLISTLTLGTGRTTILQGAVHLSLFAAYLFLSFAP